MTKTTMALITSALGIVAGVVLVIFDQEIGEYILYGSIPFLMGGGLSKVTGRDKSDPNKSGGPPPSSGHPLL